MSIGPFRRDSVVGKSSWPSSMATLKVSNVAEIPVGKLALDKEEIAVFSSLL